MTVISLKEAMNNPRPQRWKWGNWKLDMSRLVLEYKNRKHERYEVDLEECTNPEEILDWIMQLHNKECISNKDLRDFLQALDELSGGVQNHYCSDDVSCRFDLAKHLLETRSSQQKNNNKKRST
jgi:hypothetical protein